MLKAATGITCLIGCVAAQYSAKVKWLEGTPNYFGGVTFGLPWPRGQHLANATTFVVSGDAMLQSWATAYWPDGSLKWTGHALAATETPATEFTVTASNPSNLNLTVPTLEQQSSSIQVYDNGVEVVVSTGKVTATFPKKGNTLVSSLRIGNKTVGANGRLS
jgi:hypothetical protein